MKLDAEGTERAKKLLGELQDVLGDSHLPLWAQMGVLSQVICTFAEMQSGSDVTNVLLVPRFNAMLVNVPLDWSELKEQVKMAPEPGENLA